MDLTSSPLSPYWLRLLLAGCLMATSASVSGCGKAHDDTQGGGTSDSTAAASTSSSTGGMTSSASMTTTGVTASETLDTDMCASSVCTGGPGPGEPCDLWAQDCGEGYKCAFHDPDNSYPQYSRCDALDPMPRQYGEDCEIVEPSYSGDNCDEGLYCEQAGAIECGFRCGACRHFCKGAPLDTSCQHPEDLCFVAQSGDWGACVEACDPLAQDCDHPSDMCDIGTSFGDDDFRFFYCRRDWSDPEDTPGDGMKCPSKGCGSGRLCLSQYCDGEDCCTSFCDINAPNSCELKEQGYVCLSFISFELKLPPGLEHVGFCALP